MCEYAGTSCTHVKAGFDCRSYLHFTTTNWDTWQKLKVIGVPDNADEGATLSHIGYLYESKDWYYNSAGSSLITTARRPTRPRSPSTPHFAPCSPRLGTFICCAEHIVPGFRESREIKSGLRLTMF